jgi:ParB-like chromosome segregation protein Spo0J
MKTSSTEASRTQSTLAKTGRLTWSSKQIPLGDLKINPRNPHTAQNESPHDIRTSLETFGVADPLVVNLDHTLIDGERRLYIMKDLGWTETPCFLPSRLLTEKECDELAIRLHKNIGNSWDFGVLLNEFELPDLINWGFDRTELGMNVGDLNIDGKLFDERIADGVELTTTFKLSVPMNLVKRFERKLRSLLKEFPGVQVEQSL